MGKELISIAIGGCVVIKKTFLILVNVDISSKSSLYFLDGHIDQHGEQTDHRDEDDGVPHDGLSRNIISG